MNLSAHDIWDRVSELADADNAGFTVIDPPSDPASRKPLYLLIHPGDVVQKREDAMYSSDPEGILGYSMSCQEIMGEELALLDNDAWDIAVLHRFSSDYTWADYRDMNPAYAVCVQKLTGADGAVLWGDDLEAAAAYVLETMGAADRPLVVLAGAWSSEPDGCVTMVGKILEKAETPVMSSTGTCISPDGSGEEWLPERGKITTDDLLAYAPAPGMAP